MLTKLKYLNAITRAATYLPWTNETGEQSKRSSLKCDRQAIKSNKIKSTLLVNECTQALNTHLRQKIKCQSNACKTKVEIRVRNPERRKQFYLRNTNYLIKNLGKSLLQSGTKGRKIRRKNYLQTNKLATWPTRYEIGRSPSPTQGEYQNTLLDNR